MLKALTCLLILAAVFVANAADSPAQGSANEPRAEVVYDIDLDFFLSNPKVFWTHDPFRRRPGFAPISAKEEKFHLSAVLYDSEQQMAIINDQAVGVGDQVDGRTVSEIGKNYVILKRHGSEQELLLPVARDDSGELGEDSAILGEEL